MALKLDDTRRRALVEQLRVFFREKFDEDLSEYRAGELLDFLLGSLGPPIYNQAVQDARRFMLQRLEDLDGEVYEPEGA